MALGGEIPRWVPPGKAPAKPAGKPSTGPISTAPTRPAMPQSAPPTPPPFAPGGTPIPHGTGVTGVPGLGNLFGQDFHNAPAPGAIQYPWQQYADQHAKNYWDQQFGAAGLDVTDPIVQQYRDYVMNQQSSNAANANNAYAYNTAVYNSNSDALATHYYNDVVRNQEGMYRDVTLGKTRNDLDAATLAKLGALTDQQHAADVARIGQQLGYLPTDLGFIDKEHTVNLDKLGLTRRVADRGAYSAAAGAGAITSAGFRDNTHDILDQYRIGVTGADLTRDQNVESVNRNRDALNKAATDTNLAYNKDLVNRDAQKAQIGLANDALDSIGREYGANLSDIGASFKSSMEKAGLDYDKTMQQIGQNLQSGDASLIAGTIQFMYEMMAMQTGNVTGPLPTLPGMPGTNGAQPGGLDAAGYPLPVYSQGGGILDQPNPTGLPTGKAY